MEAEVGSRMLERLDYFRIAPRRILDAGSGPVREAKALAARYRGAQLVALDFSLPVLRGAHGWFRFLSRRQAVCADLARLPLVAESIDLVWSNMALHWSDDPAAALKEFRRVLAADGLLMFSTLGPDTLKELRAAAGPERVHAFIDMHDIGDMLVAAGFAAPVMDMEMLTLSYPRAGALLADLRASGQTSARVDRPRGLAGRGFRERLLAALPPRASFEVVYGHAWKGAPREHRETVKTIGLYRRLS
ncbi:MAG TPA: methyltransferase domain-containing protein [Burkholderiales bacterium]|jgi:malonyl-CoA O-methyltransferase|nr:methyltransferase domain-containing protein [Burkholderiales bacterium]